MRDKVKLDPTLSDAHNRLGLGYYNLGLSNEYDNSTLGALIIRIGCPTAQG